MCSKKPILKNYNRSWISHIIDEIEMGTADPINADLLLECFCNSFDNQEKIPKELLRYLRNAFKAYINQEKKIDVALGISRKKGRPKADPEKRIKMATEVLRLRLQDITHQAALEEISENFHCSQTIIGEAWAEYQFFAISHLARERSNDKYPWTLLEIERMNKMFSDRVWYIKPEKPNPLKITPEK